jgi:hypothetical protein
MISFNGINLCRTLSSPMLGDTPLDRAKKLVAQGNVGYACLSL